MNKILITGGSGFVGSSLALAWKRDFPDDTVVALDNLKRRGSELNIARLRDGGVRFIHGDVRNPEDLEQAEPPSLIVDCSAEPAVSAGYGQSPAYLLNTNLVGTINCLEVARKAGADVVLLSTSRVYPLQALNAIPLTEGEKRFELADDARIPGLSRNGISENFTLEGARSLYGATKLASELLLLEYLHAYGLRGVINRCGVITGPWQMGKVDQGFVVLWVARHLLGGNLTYTGFGGCGKQVRDVLHVMDLYELLRRQVSQLSRCSGKIYNVGGGPTGSVSLLELTELAGRVTGKNIHIGSVPETAATDMPYYVSDSGRVREETGWQPVRPPAAIVEEIVVWIGENRAILNAILS